LAHKFDVVVIGAGAAGLFCAAQAGQLGLKVLLVDHSEKVAEKIRISGGGRCNFTNRDATPAQFLGENPHFCRSALSRYTPQDFIELLQRHRSLSRKAQGPAVLRPFGRRHHQHAAGRVRRRPGDALAALRHQEHQKCLQPR
jgi:predicted flavoprotein YhiN